jgi:hypothetical protein
MGVRSERTTELRASQCVKGREMVASLTRRGRTPIVMMKDRTITSTDRLRATVHTARVRHR